jgi:hypothetical protein
MRYRNPYEVPRQKTRSRVGLSYADVLTSESRRQQKTEQLARLINALLHERRRRIWGARY